MNVIGQWEVDLQKTRETEEKLEVGHSKENRGEHWGEGSWLIELQIQQVPQTRQEMQKLHDADEVASHSLHPEEMEYCRNSNHSTQMKQNAKFKVILTVGPEPLLTKVVEQ